MRSMIYEELQQREYSTKEVQLYQSKTNQSTSIFNRKTSQNNQSSQIIFSVQNSIMHQNGTPKNQSYIKTNHEVRQQIQMNHNQDHIKMRVMAQNQKLQQNLYKFVSDIQYYEKNQIKTNEILKESRERILVLRNKLKQKSKNILLLTEEMISLKKDNQVAAAEVVLLKRKNMEAKTQYLCILSNNKGKQLLLEQKYNELMKKNTMIEKNYNELEAELHQVKQKEKLIHHEYQSKIENIYLEKRQNLLEIDRGYELQMQKLIQELNQSKQKNYELEILLSSPSSKEIQLLREIEKQKERNLKEENKIKQYQKEFGKITDKVIQFNQIVQNLRGSNMSKDNEVKEYHQIIHKLKEVVKDYQIKEQAQIQQIKELYQNCQKLKQKRKEEIMSEKNNQIKCHQKYEQFTLSDKIQKLSICSTFNILLSGQPLLPGQQQYQTESTNKKTVDSYDQLLRDNIRRYQFQVGIYQQKIMFLQNTIYLQNVKYQQATSFINYILEEIKEQEQPSQQQQQRSQIYSLIDKSRSKQIINNQFKDFKSHKMLILCGIQTKLNQTLEAANNNFNVQFHNNVDPKIYQQPDKFKAQNLHLSRIIKTAKDDIHNILKKRRVSPQDELGIIQQQFTFRVIQQ